MATLEEFWESTIKEARTTLLETESYTAYLALVVRKYKNRDVFLKWVVAASACTPFIAKVQGVSQPVASWFLALIPLLALLLPMLKYSDLIEHASILHGKHAIILNEIRKLFRELEVNYREDHGLIDMAKTIIHNNQDRLAELASEKLKVPDDEKLKNTASSQVRDYPKPWESNNYSSSTGGGAVINFTSSPPR